MQYVVSFLVLNDILKKLYQRSGDKAMVLMLLIY